MKPVANKPRFRPETFGKFTLIAPIATGGMGELFLARMRADSGFERLVVIKRILPHLTDKPEFVNMFVDEARVAAQIHHPNVCQILEFGQIEGRYYMALEYLEGISLTQVIVAGREHDKLRELRFLIAIMTQVCEGLHFAHNLQTPSGALAGVVHRDVNPKNIFVTSAGVSKVIDFGIVKALGAINVTRTGSVKGTYSYMSPEQIKATAVDRRSDVFSLGTVTWESITGVRLFKRENDFHTWRAITEDPIPPPSQFREGLPAALDAVLAKALERDKSARYATAREFGLALEQALSASGGPLTPVAVASRIEQAFEDEFERQRQRTFAPSSIDDEEPVKNHDFEVHVDPMGGATVTATPSAHRGARPHFDSNTSTGSDISDRPLVTSAPITGSNPSPVPPITGSDITAGPPVTDSNINLGPPPVTNSDIALGPPPSPSVFGVNESSQVSSPALTEAPKRRTGLVMALLLTAAIFTLAAVLFVTRRGPAQAKAPEENVAVPDDPIEKTPDETVEPKETAKEVTPDDEARKERERREEEARQKAEKEAEEAKKKERRDKERKEKERKERELAEKERKEKERKEKEREEREKREKELAKLPKGTLHVSSMPYGTVYIDGKNHGTSPVTGVRLKPGKVRVRVESSAGTKSKTVTIRSGKTSRAIFKFDN